MGPYAKAADFFIEIFAHFQWEKIGLMYHDNFGRGSPRSDCYFILETLFFAIHDVTKGTEAWYTNFDENVNDKSVRFRELLLEVQLNTRSKIVVITCKYALNSQSERIFCLQLVTMVLAIITVG